MARVEKYKQTAVRALIAHNDRAFSNSSNKEIDRTKTHLNYKLHPERKGKVSLVKEDGKLKARSEPMSDMEYYELRKSQLHVHRPADFVAVIGWLITLPKDTAPQDQERFFSDAYEFLSLRYGGKERENVINCSVHLDESRPHMHFLCIPAVANPKKAGGKNEKICAKSILTKAELTSFHPSLAEHMRSAKINCSVITGETRGRSRHIGELKRDTARQAQERDRERPKGVFTHDHDR